MIKILLFLILNIFVFSSQNRISDIDTLYSKVTEKLYLNNEIKEKVYEIEYISPSYLRKTIISPEVNSGEIYQYENGKSELYIPLFGEVSENNNADISNFLTIINRLKEKELKDVKFKKSYYKKEVNEIDLDEKYSMKIEKYETINNYLLPVKIKILENGNKVAELDLKNIKVNDLNIKKRKLK